MELFLLFIYALSVFVVYQTLKSKDDSDINDDEDSGEYNLIEEL